MRRMEPRFTSLRLIKVGAMLGAFCLPATAVRALELIGQQAANVQPFLGDDFEMVDWDGPVQQGISGRYYGNNPEQVMRSRIQQALQTARTPGKDVWVWRDQVESQLVTVGRSGISLLREQLGQRDGYERDALQVAIFRLANGPLYPNTLLNTWARRNFAVSGSEPPPYKITRVLDVRDAVNLCELFPHHLFYAIEYPAKKVRVVVALAADGMVQPLPDDAVLGRFIGHEAVPQVTQVGKERVAAAAALLAAARSSTIYKPDRLRVEGQLPTFTITLDAAALHETLTATFGPAGTLETLMTGQEKVEVKPAAPVVVPTAVKPPPAMPE
jgi:hypothetical protein